MGTSGCGLQIRVGCEFVYQTEMPVPMLMLVRPNPHGQHRLVYESRWTDPSINVHEYEDTFGNLCWRLLSPPGRLVMRYDALVETSAEPDATVLDAPLVPVEHLPDETLVFTLPSRYIQSDLLISRAWELFGNTPPTWERVQAVCDWVHQNIRYETGNTDPSVTAVDVLERGVGVCRDFALLAAGLCRALNIPARYTFGYLPDIAVEPPDVPMDFHAWFEAYIRWAVAHVRRATQRPPHRTRPGRTRSRCRGCGAHDHLWRSTSRHDAGVGRRSSDWVRSPGIAQ